MLAYWAVLAFLSIYESTMEWAVAWVPLYYEAKVALLAWLVTGVAARCLGLAKATSPDPAAHSPLSWGSGSWLSQGLQNDESRSSSVVRRWGLDGARFLFTKVLHPALLRVDSLLVTRAAPIVARAMVRLALIAPLRPTLLSLMASRRSLAPVPPAERDAWTAVLSAISGEVAAELARRGVQPSPALPLPPLTSDEGGSSGSGASGSASSSRVTVGGSALPGSGSLLQEPLLEQSMESDDAASDDGDSLARGGGGAGRVDIGHDSNGLRPGRTSPRRLSSLSAASSGVTVRSRPGKVRGR